VALRVQSGIGSRQLSGDLISRSSRAISFVMATWIIAVAGCSGRGHERFVVADLMGMPVHRAQDHVPPDASFVTYEIGDLVAGRPGATPAALGDGDAIVVAACVHDDAPEGEQIAAGVVPFQRFDRLTEKAARAGAYLRLVPACRSQAPRNEPATCGSRAGGRFIHEMCDDERARRNADEWVVRSSLRSSGDQGLAPSR
jgi:hypothetical protein